MNVGHAAEGLRAGSLVAGKFLLQRTLGQGGMGAVWLAQHTALRIPCAVKFLHPSVARSADVRARFEREAVAAAQLRSPNVVQILDHGVWEGAPYIAMELLDGEDLADRLKRVGRLSPRETAAIVGQVARALTRAHAAGLVHRDLKPANLFLVRDDDREIVKVLDFGIAKVTTGPEVDGMTKTGAMLGTPYYMSPEQAQGSKSVDHRSDLWSLGVLTFQCLTGALPFWSTALGDLLMGIIVRPLPVPSQVAPVPPGFDGWWSRAASRDPAGRFQSAREMSDALDAALGVTAGEGAALGRQAPVAAPPASPVGSPSGMQAEASLAPSAAASSAVTRVRSKSRAGLVATALVIAATLLFVGGFFALRARARPATTVDGVQLSTAQVGPSTMGV